MGETVLSPVRVFGSLVGCRCMDLHLGSLFCSLLHWSLCGFCFEVKYYDGSSFGPPRHTHDALGSSGLFMLPYEFLGLFFSLSVKITVHIFMEIASNL